MEIAPGIHLIAGNVGVRPLQLYLLRGASRCVLLDTGCAPDPKKIIFPYLRSIGLRPDHLDMVINTHCDMDHCGGNHAIKTTIPAIQITCGTEDQASVEDPQVMWDTRYNAYEKEHGIGYDTKARQSIFAAMGRFQAVDRTWDGGETLDLGAGWEVEIHHTPGHSHGHLAVFDPRSGTLLSGDAVHGSMYPDDHGDPVLCPTYLDVERYHQTILKLESLPIERLATCHWPIKRGSAVQEFLAESRLFVDQAERAVVAGLQSAPNGLSLRELIADVGPSLGSWPRETDTELVYAVAGHVDLLASQRRVVALPGTRPVVFRIGD